MTKGVMHAPTTTQTHKHWIANNHRHRQGGGGVSRATYADRSKRTNRENGSPSCARSNHGGHRRDSNHFPADVPAACASPRLKGGRLLGTRDIQARKGLMPCQTCSACRRILPAAPDAHTNANRRGTLTSVSFFFTENKKLVQYCTFGRSNQASSMEYTSDPRRLLAFAKSLQTLCRDTVWGTSRPPTAVQFKLAVRRLT